MWNGPDVPQKPATADLVISGDQAKITWSAAAATGLHGKPIDVSKLTYKITRYPDKVLVNDNVKGTSFTDNIDNFKITNLLL